MSVADAGRFLDSPRHVVVVVAELESQELDLVRRFSHGVVEDAEPSGRRHALPCGHRDQVKLVSVTIRHCAINDSARLRVLEPRGVACKDARVHTLGTVDVHELARVTDRL